MKCEIVKFSGHAVAQMFQRRISKVQVRHVIEKGETIKEYPDDKPYPSKLLLGFSDRQPIHVVLAYDDENETCFVVTAYKPDPVLWDEDFRKKKMKK